MVNAKSIMTRAVIFIPESALLSNAIDLLITHKISALMVVGENNTLVGIVSEMDVLIAYDFLNDIQQPIRDFISRNVISVHEETPVNEICKVLVQENIKRVPVLDGKTVVGVVSRSDILNYIKSSKK